MTKTTHHLLHLAALAVLFYLAALAARTFGLTVAVAIFLPLGMLVETRFWWILFTGGKRNRDADRPV